VNTIITIIYSAVNDDSASPMLTATVVFNEKGRILIFDPLQNLHCRWEKNFAVDYFCETNCWPSLAQIRPPASDIYRKWV